ncbi:hypothetical protein ACS0TY_030653 [Phlomoides rotata]
MFGRMISYWTGVPKVTTPRGVHSACMKVCDLMEDGSATWNNAYIDTIFTSAEAERIKNIPLCGSGRSDAMSWKFTKNGMYTAKSGYMDVATKIWGLEAVPRVRYFAWKLVHGILPSNINLIGRFVDVDPMCKRCGMEIKTTMHALRDCSAITALWDDDPLRLQVQRPADVPFEDLVISFLNGATSSQGLLFIILLRELWYVRNKFVFQDTSTSNAVILSTGRLRFREYKDLYRDRSGVSPDHSEIWVPPHQGFVKLNTDASVRVGIGSLIAGVLRNEGGQVIWCFAEQVRRNLDDVELMEALAIRRGMRLAVQHGVRNMLVESDSQIVIRLLLKSLPDLSYLGGVLRYSNAL